MRWLCPWRPWNPPTPPASLHLHRWVFHHHPGMGFLKFPAAAPGISRALQKVNEHFLTKRWYGFLYKGSLVCSFPLFHSMKCEWIDSLTSYPCHKQSTWDSIWWLFFKCSQQFASGHVSFGKLLRLQCLPSWELTYPIQRYSWRWFLFSSCGICYFPGG